MKWEILQHCVIVVSQNNKLLIRHGAGLCLKYYRASRYNVRCVTIVLVERGALVAKINDLHFWKTNT